MKSMCGCKGWCANPHFGLLALRVVTGLIFIHHGWLKFQNMPGTESFFASLHLWPWLATFVAAVEVVGGLALVLGIFTCIAAPLLAITIAVAILLATLPNGGLGGSELEFALLASLIAVKSVGCGKWKAPGHCGCFGCGMWGKGKDGDKCVDCGHNPELSTCDCGCHK